MIQKKEIVVLGGGISGLSLAWYLRKYHPGDSVRLLEQCPRVGGVITHVIEDGVIFDQGPKTFRMANGAPILELIEEMGLTDQLVFSSEEACKRYLYYHKKLYQMPTHLLSCLLSPLTRKALPALLKEPFVQKSGAQDETIGAFVRRRFGNYIADVFIEPFVMGICGGDMHKLSIRSYFPNLKRGEEEYGSVIKALLARKKKGTSHGLFNLKGGLSTLTEALGQQLQEMVYFNHQGQEVRKVGERLEIQTNKGVFLADHLFLAVPLPVVKNMSLPFNQKQGFFHDISVASLVSVSFAYKEDVLRKKGFGYLVPSCEREKILGVLFDKTTFPTLDASVYKTKLTVMMGGALHPDMIHYSDGVLIQHALDALFAHLGIDATPDLRLVSRYPEAIPQYPLYHRERLEQLQHKIKRECPNITLAGNYLTQAAVAACITQSKILAQEYKGC